MILPLRSYTSRTSYHGEPVAGSRFGKHLGVDLATPVGTPVYAPVSGRIGLVVTTPDVGNQIQLDGVDGKHHRLLHLSRFNVRQGQQVSEGDLIAWSGNEGAVSTGPHLHWDIRRGGTSWYDSFNNYFDPSSLVSIPRSLAITNNPIEQGGNNTVVLTEEAVRTLYLRLFNREGDPGGIRNYTGKTLDFALNDMLGSKEFQTAHVKTVERVVEKPVEVIKELSTGAVDATLRDKANKYDAIKEALK